MKVLLKYFASIILLTFPKTLQNFNLNNSINSQQMDFQEYKQKTLGDEIKASQALVKLFNFEKKAKGYYSESFELDTFDDDTFEYYFEFDKKQTQEYLKHIKPFATVDGTGGFAAFWVLGESIDNAPIIVFGSEGNIKIVAKNLFDFMRLLTFDSELMDGVSTKSLQEYKPSTYKNEFITFLKKEFDLEPVSDITHEELYGNSKESIQITKEAEKLYKDKFIKWHQQFFDISEYYNLETD